MFCFVQMREQFFFCLEFSGMDAPSTASQLDRMLEVKHLVINQILDRILGNKGAVEDLAYHDGIVRGIIVP